ncbi:guanine deaminase [Sulfitobacter sp. KE29]|uniref:guanine deaminase n=2 Tax=Roseobacteraceae TaxID=2854170 RepID=UPI0007C21011|nr:MULTISPECIES: guanine deaminase [Sulfitobacter]MBL93881.1 guanine deaminase [Magnetovibrio sp.]KZY51697.1 guanine deaminase [Sulfitobacter sp. HI0054]MBO9440034.1 guanine deaminase [Sulfitobacter sp. R18_2]MDF3419855.1 guanine deaminase [Sulfitobacter sp. Ks38]MDF3427263.1 guanine deaminase [Sulfitobacter sp. KE29]
MTKKLLRWRLLTFHRAPQDGSDTDSYCYHEDAGLLICDGIIKDSGPFDSILAKAPDVSVTDHRPYLMMAGFIDTHIHFPQVQVIASWGSQLLDWLNNYTFPEETRFACESHSERMAQAFFDQLIAHGTTSAVAYCSVHKTSADAFFSEATRRNMRMLGGKVLMDRDAPAELRDTPQEGYDETKALISEWHGKGRNGYVISPRFAITSTPEQMQMAMALANEHPDCHIQTHLSENKDEIAFTKALYPQAQDYLDVYQSYGLLRNNTLLGHAIHLEPREIDALADTGAHPVFCPTSNFFLGSGLFNHHKLNARGILNGIATDVGAGTSYSMLQTLNEGYKVLQLQGQSLHPLQAFDWATRGNAQVLGLEDKIGTLAVGTEADVVILNSSATSAMALRMERAESLAEELFVLQIMGDDRAIEEVYLSGVAQKVG